MNGSHLSDNDIQHFIEGQLTEDNEKIQHLAGCIHCQQQFNIYKSVYLAAAELPVVVDPKLADIVMNRITAPGRKKAFDFSDKLVFASMGCCFIFLLLFLGSSAGSNLIVFVTMLAKSTHGQFIGLLCFAGILLVVFQVMDTRLMNIYYNKKKLV